MSDMKIVNMKGGLGNQMFEYAFAVSLRERFPQEKVLVDASHYGHIFFKSYKGANLHNGFEIHKVFPNADIRAAKPWQLLRVTWYMPNYVLSRVVRRILPIRKGEVIQKESEFFTHNEEYYNLQGDRYFEGIWESAHNYIPIRDVLRHVYEHGEPNAVNRAYIDEIGRCNSVGIHIRRGDYLKVPEFRGICDLEYYTRAIREVLEDGQEHVFYLFSNDMEWCRENIVPLCAGQKVVMVTENVGKESCWDMFLMTYCQDLIIANSSFSWWAAFLNRRDGRVFAPHRWFNREGVEFDVWLDDWIRI